MSDFIIEILFIVRESFVVLIACGCQAIQLVSRMAYLRLRRYNVGRPYPRYHNAENFPRAFRITQAEAIRFMNQFYQ